jgi:heat shock protein HtpX
MRNPYLWAIASLFWLSCGCVMAQADADENTPTLYLYPAPDASLWVLLELPLEPENPENPDGLNEAMGVMLGESDPSYVGDYYDGMEDGLYYWSSYWENSIAIQDADLTAALDVEPLRDPLRALDYTQLDITVYGVDRHTLLVPWDSTALESDNDNEVAWAVFPLANPLPKVPITCERIPDSNPSHYLPVPLLLLTLAVFVLLLRARALRRPAEEAGFACLQCTQRYLYAVILFWIALGMCLHRWSPLEPLVYGVDGMAPYHIPLLFLLWVGLGTLASMLSHVCLLPVYLRIPGSTWTRSDFSTQAFWFSMLLVAISTCAIAGVANLDSGLLYVLSLVLVGALAGFYCYLRLLHALGFAIQALDEGDLHERVLALAEEAKIPALQGVYMLYRSKSPMINALAATQLRVAFTEELLRGLTRREVDAIAGHELAHLVHNHPAVLVRVRLLTMFTGIIIGSVLAIVLMVAVLVVAPAFPRDLWMPVILACVLAGIVIGALFQLRYSRKFEYQADAGSVAITGDAEAMIAALVKLTRLSHMPMEWGGKWSARFITHPSTGDRIWRLAERFDVPHARLEALIEGESVGEGHYDIPETASPDRVFTTQHKTRVQLVNMLQHFLAAPLVPVALAWLGNRYFESGLAMALVFVLMVAGGLAILCWFQNRASLRGFHTLAQRFRERHSIDEGDGSGGDFVTLAPNRHMDIYDGFTSWDVGLLNLDEEYLHYQGDGTTFSLSRESVSEVSLQRIAASAIPVQRALVRYMPSGTDEEPRHLAFSFADSSRLTAANRVTRTLYERIHAWHAGTPENSGFSAPVRRFEPPQTLTARGVPAKDAFQLNQLLVFSIFIFMAGCAMGVAAGLPHTTPLGHSAIGVGIAGTVAAVLSVTPTWWAARRGESMSDAKID